MDKPSNKKLSRQEQNDLDVEISFLEGVVQRDRNYVEALQLLGDDETKRGRLYDGLAIDRKLARLCPQDPLVFYNLACSYSLTGEFRKSANSLRKALAHGYRDFKWLRQDPDLEPLRRQPVFSRIEAEIAGIE